MRRALTTLALLAFASLVAIGASRTVLPLPFLLGPLLCIGLIATTGQRHLPEGYSFPQPLRTAFIAIIGLMIGAQVTPDLFANAPRFAVSLAALIIFVTLCLAGNYLIFRRLGRYDRATAFYASTPGGLYESLSMGEAAGADMPRLILQQFLRVIVVVTLLPIGLSLWLGEPVGSASGVSLARAAVPLSALPLIALAGAGGYALGRVLRLPAGQLTGPLVVAAALSLTGTWPLDIPQWLVNLAQIVIGTALGMRFTGLSRALILRGIGLSLITVGFMLTLAAGFAALLAPVLAEPFDVMLISFAPGGVTEMALVALSLQANPALVTLHHILRILLTVLAMLATASRIRRL